MKSSVAGRLQEAYDYLHLQYLHGTPVGALRTGDRFTKIRQNETLGCRKLMTTYICSTCLVYLSPSVDS